MIDFYIVYFIIGVLLMASVRLRAKEPLSLIGMAAAAIFWPIFLLLLAIIYFENTKV
jgi:hypothetical protein